MTVFYSYFSRSALISLCGIIFLLSGNNSVASNKQSDINEELPLYLKITNSEALFDTNSVHINLCDTRVKNNCTPPNRDLKLAGQKLNTITIAPKIAGEWRFHGNYSIVFTPEIPFKANQAYKITVDKKIFPSFVSLRDDIVTLQTLPLLSAITEMAYLQDQNDIVKKLLQAKIRFNYPIDPKSLEERLVLERVSTKEKLPFSVTFNDNNTEVIATSNIKALTPQEDTVTMNIKEGVKPTYGGENLYHKNFGNKKYSPAVVRPMQHEALQYSYKEQVLIPSIYSYLKIDAKAAIVQDQHGADQQVIIINTNAPVSTAEISKHLTIFLLPQDKPSAYGKEPQTNYAWQNPEEITEDIKNDLEKIDFTPLPTSLEYSTMHSFKVATQSERYLLLKVSPGMKAQADLILGKDYDSILLLPTLPTRLKFMQNGMILPLSGKKNLDIYSAGLDKIYLEIDKIDKANIHHFISQLYNNVPMPLAKGYGIASFSEYNISTVLEEEVEVKTNKNAPGYSTLDFSKYLSTDSPNKYFFLTKLSHKGTYGDVVVDDKKLINATDMAFFVKTEQDDIHHIFVSSFVSGKPLADVKVAIVGLNGEPLVTSKTDINGHAVLPSIATFNKEKTPTSYVLTSANDFTFMPYYDTQLLNNMPSDWQNIDYSKIKAYLFSDRGIYKPGEKSNIGIMVKPINPINWHDDLMTLSLELHVASPRGATIDEKKIALNKEGIAEYSLQTSEDSDAGTYNISLYLAKDEPTKEPLFLGAMQVNYQDFLPDKMKITANFSEDDQKLWLLSDNLSVMVNLMNLYGTPAIKRKISGNIDLKYTELHIPSLQDYVFYTGERENNADLSIKLPDLITDDHGLVNFSLPLKKYTSPIAQLTFAVEGFEAGSGRSVATAKSCIISKLPYVIGFKPDSDPKHFKQNSHHTIEFISVDNAGNKINTTDLSLELKNITYVTRLVADADGGYSYKSIPRELPLSHAPLTIPNSSYVYTVPTDDIGDYVVYLSNGQGDTVAKVEFSVVNDDYVNSEKNINLTLNKDNYKAGEKILINLTTPYVGYGLITIETDKIHNFTWFTTHQTNSVQKIAIPENFEGKGFVNVQFMKNMSDTETFTSPFIQATTPFTAEITDHEQKILLETQSKMTPGQSLAINYSTAKPGKIIIYAVDEGVLSYSNYQVPDPIDYFIKNKNLGVKTSYITNLILPNKPLMIKAREASMQMMAAPPQIMEVADNINSTKHLNPFKRNDKPTIAFWSGILDSDKSPKTIKFPIPDYFNGTVKVVAVAAIDNAVGSSSKNVQISSDLIITPNLPLFIAPHDRFTVPVTIANNIPNSCQGAAVRLNITASEGLKILEYPKEITVSMGTENTFEISLQATESLGSAELKIVATTLVAGPPPPEDSPECRLLPLDAMSYNITANTTVRPAAPYVTTVDTGYEKGNEVERVISRDLYPEFSKLQIFASKLPLAIIGGFKQYLDNYQFDATLPLVSKSFSSVMLYTDDELMNIMHLEREKIDELLNKTFQILLTRQNHDGGFKAWNYYGDSNDFISAYTMHFLTEAMARHLPVPGNMFKTGLYYLKYTSSRAAHSLDSAREKAYAVYVLARNNEATPQDITNILDYLKTSQKNYWQGDLAAVYLAASYKILQMNEEAEKILNNFYLTKPIADTLITAYAYYDAVIKYSQYLYIISLHFPEKLKTLGPDISLAITRFVGDRYNPLSANYAIMASIAYADNINNQQDTAVKFTTYAAHKVPQQTLALQGKKILDATIDALGAQSVQIRSSTNGFFYQLLTSGLDKRLAHDKEIVHGVELVRKLLNDKGAEIARVKLGDIITVSYILISASHDILRFNIAVVDLLPGGFELVEYNTALEDKTLLPLWKPDYINRREDRIIMFGTIPNYKVHYQYKIRAINKGTFTVAAPYAESMYDPTIYYKGVVSKIVVE